MEAGYYLEKKKKKERKLASLRAWLVVFFFLGEAFLFWPNLPRRRRRCLVVSHLGRSLPTQRPRLEEEYGRRSRGFSTRYN